MSEFLRPYGLYSSWDFLGQNTGVGSLSLHQGIFPTQGSNPGLLHRRRILYQLSHREAQEYWSGKPIPSPADLPDPEIEPGSPALQADSLPTELSVQFSSVTQSCLTLCDPMDCTIPGFPVHHQLLELTQTHVHRVSNDIQSSHPLWSPSPPAFNLSQHQGLFQ